MICLHFSAPRKCTINTNNDYIVTVFHWNRANRQTCGDRCQRTLWWRSCHQHHQLSPPSPPWGGSRRLGLAVNHQSTPTQKEQGGGHATGAPITKCYYLLKIMKKNSLRLSLSPTKLAGSQPFLTHENGKF